MATAMATTKSARSSCGFSDSRTWHVARNRITAPDKEYPDRFVLIGLSGLLRVLFIVSAEAGDRIRIISARKASPCSARCTNMVRKRETDLRRYDFRKARRGKYVRKARRSVETIIVDKKVLETLGGHEGLTAILQALAKSVERAKKKRRAA